MDKDRVIAMAARVFPQPKKTRDEVAAAAETVRNTGGIEAPGLESLEAPGAPLPPEEEIFGLPRTDVLNKRLSDGARALDKVNKGKTDLTPGEALGLEAIVLLFGRPALLVQDGDFGTPPEEWKHLDGKREMLKSILPSVGRVDLDGHPSFEWCGTAWMAGDGVLMTNRHVASLFASQSDKGWSFSRGVKARVDYKEEFQRDTPSEFKIEKVLGTHPEYDLALLKVSTKGTKTRKSPPPLTISTKPPKATKDNEVAVIGYPAFDSRNGRTEQLDIFKNIFNVKRLLPGRNTGLVQKPQVMGHDCSTLGGNSGSCVVDLETGKVIALHFGGRFMENNFSVPLWKLAKDPLLTKHKVNFG